MLFCILKNKWKLPGFLTFNKTESKKIYAGWPCECVPDFGKHKNKSGVVPKNSSVEFILDFIFFIEFISFYPYTGLTTTLSKSVLSNFRGNFFRENYQNHQKYRVIQGNQLVPLAFINFSNIYLV
jgi:hypothetical protein